MALKDATELTKEEALAELATLKEDVEFDSSFDEKTPVAKLRALVQEGRDALKTDTPPARLSRAPEKPAAKQPLGDYLRQYQYRQNTRIGSPESDPPKNSKAAKMKELLLKQPTQRFFIPRKDTEPRIITQSCTINDYHLELPKGKYIELPVQICDHLAESLGQTNAAYDAMDMRSGLGRVKEAGSVESVLG